MEKSVAFRQGHGVVGQLLAYCEKKGKKLAELSLEEFGKFSKAIGKDVYKRLGAANVAGTYIGAGAAGVKQANNRIAYWQRQLANLQTK